MASLFAETVLRPPSGTVTAPPALTCVVPPGTGLAESRKQRNARADATNVGPGTTTPKGPVQ